MTLALKRKAAQKAADMEQEGDKYSRALAEEGRKRGGAGGGLGGGGGFLDNLTFVRDARGGAGGGAGAGRLKPSGLGPRLKGR